MSWMKKLFSYFLGDDEKVSENSETREHEQEAQRNIGSVSKSENETQNHHKAEARVSYQYPKGNFRFPMIPDEKQTSRDMRPRRSSHEKLQTKSEVRPVLPNHKSVKKRYIEENVEEKPIKKKQPFYPTSIPSPIYGFQSKEERMQSRETQHTKQKQPQSLADSSYMEESVTYKMETEVPIQSNYEMADTPAALKIQEENDQQATTIEQYDRSDEFQQEEETTVTYSLEDHEIEEMVYETNADTVIDDKEDDDLVDEALSIVKTEFNKKQPPVEFDQALEIEQIEQESVEMKPSYNDQYEEEEQTEFYLNEDQSETFFEETKVSGFENESFEESIKEQEEPILHQPETPKQESNNRKTLPFNVMMLGRDKQKIREKTVQVQEQTQEQTQEKTQEQAQVGSYQFPSLGFLNIPEKELTEDHTWLESQKDLLNLTLKNFNVRASVVNVTQGPSVTRFEVHPEPGVKVNKITNLSDDIKLSLAAKDIRIEAPIPGKNTIGIEVPNKVGKMVYLREILRSSEFRNNPSPMTAVLGLDIAGQPAVTDLKKMPHGLIAGATGSGKSVCINTILVSLLYKASPHEVKLMLIDPKMVELAPYNDIPHLVSPVITDVKAATAALKWAVEEMERRYELFAHSGTREITRYNQLVKEHNQGEHLPYLVIVIDELADLMMVAPNDVEEAICRIAQKARACGIHLIVATQRPSVDVITGLIKANIPTRIAFSVSSQVDSRTIIDVSGAEKLLGKGDMLFLENGSSKAVRLQGTFVSDEEIERVVKHVKLQSKPEYLFHQEELVKKATIQSEEDELFVEACEFVVNQGGASTSSLQRRFRIGYNRAARLIDMMEDQGIISENRGSKPRDVLISEEELDSIHESNV
ncbi:DNA translocase FtsK [Metabacillus sp. B2-18]|uniref:DNA translocase FtsK n=1 Tax=Metabacillus sp. B2-18 TaxID=2897333 RepID=UPI001E42A598|nr:DNA translocase FtsK [Metabacillus sp. B2-18]UGB29836.1 DNA translocase FtsK [Metabacillus sp. B2-18]